MDYEDDDSDISDSRRDIELDPNNKNKFMFACKKILDQVENIYCCGIAGSGKSTLCRQYIEQYLYTFPKNNVYLFSCKTKDKAFDDLVNENIIARIPLDETFEEFDLNYKDFDNSLCIFDDCENLKLINKKTHKKLYDLKNTINTLGRDIGTYTFEINHITRNSALTKTILSEATAHIFFFNSQPRDVNILLKDYLGFDKDTINQIRAIKSRWYYINAHEPRYLITEKNIILL